MREAKKQVSETFRIQKFGRAFAMPIISHDLNYFEIRYRLYRIVEIFWSLLRIVQIPGRTYGCISLLPLSLPVTLPVLLSILPKLLTFKLARRFPICEKLIYFTSGSRSNRGLFSRKLKFEPNVLLKHSILKCFHFWKVLKIEKGKLTLNICSTPIENFYAYHF